MLVLNLFGNVFVKYLQHLADTNTAKNGDTDTLTQL